ncbi:zinc finger protein 888-like [Branchiostoma floridae]|uniref:Zinc finger protein 888-like n=1 Tax=Branchiostoma floridae TaxID=7739 RepID=A0A9J7HPW2_BRAFL|nr:zinc finger protein 888-like [Branchiostoma floridae]
MPRQQEFICGLSHEVTIAVLPRLNMEELMFELNRRIQNLDKQNSIKDRLVSILRDVMLEEYRQLKSQSEMTMPEQDCETVLVTMHENIPTTYADTLLTATSSSSPLASLQNSGLDIVNSEENNDTSNEVLMPKEELALHAVQVQLKTTLSPSDTSLIQTNNVVDFRIKEEEDVAMTTEDEAGKACHDELDIDISTFSMQELDTINPMGHSCIEKPLEGNHTFENTALTSSEPTPDYDQIGQSSQPPSLNQDDGCTDDRETGLVNSGHEQSLKVNIEETASCEVVVTQDQDSENRVSLLSNKNSGVNCERYTCDVRGYNTSKVHKISKHRQHHKEKPFMCGECGYRASNKPRLVDHMRKHTGEKPFKCNQCHYQASYKSLLVKHMKKHSDEEPYCCDICEYKTYNWSHIKRHMKYHAGVRPYKCEQCDYSAVVKDNLTKHMKCHTRERPYCCKMCSFQASQKANLVKHMITKHQ